MGVYRFLQQDRIWVDKEKVEHQVAEMGPRHCANVVRFLDRQAQQLAAQSALELACIPLPDSDTQAFLSVTADLDREVEQMFRDPAGWLRSTPLMTVLKNRAAEVA